MEMFSAPIKKAISIPKSLKTRVRSRFNHQQDNVLAENIDNLKENDMEMAN